MYPKNLILQDCVYLLGANDKETQTNHGCSGTCGFNGKFSDSFKQSFQSLELPKTDSFHSDTQKVNVKCIVPDKELEVVSFRQIIKNLDQPNSVTITNESVTEETPDESIQEKVTTSNIYSKEAIRPFLISYTGNCSDTNKSPPSCPKCDNTDDIHSKCTKNEGVNLCPMKTKDTYSNTSKESNEKPIFKLCEPETVPKVCVKDHKFFLIPPKKHDRLCFQIQDPKVCCELKSPKEECSKPKDCKEKIEETDCEKLKQAEECKTKKEDCLLKLKIREEVERKFKEEEEREGAKRKRDECERKLKEQQQKQEKQRLKEECDKRQKEEDEVRKMVKECSRKRIEAQEQRQKEEAERKKEFEELQRKRFEEEKRKKREEAEKKRIEAEERTKRLEQCLKKRIEAEIKRQEEEVNRKKREEEEKKKIKEECERKIKEAIEKKKREEEAEQRKREEEEKKRQEDEKRLREECERKRKEEQERINKIKEECERQLREEEEKMKQEEEFARQLREEKLRLQREAFEKELKYEEEISRLREQCDLAKGEEERKKAQEKLDRKLRKENAICKLNSDYQERKRKEEQEIRQLKEACEKEKQEAERMKYEEERRKREQESEDMKQRLKKECQKKIWEDSEREKIKEAEEELLAEEERRKQSAHRRKSNEKENCEGYITTKPVKKCSLQTDGDKMLCPAKSLDQKSSYLNSIARDEDLNCFCPDDNFEDVEDDTNDVNNPQTNINENNFQKPSLSSIIGCQPKTSRDFESSSKESFKIAGTKQLVYIEKPFGLEIENSSNNQSKTMLEAHEKTMATLKCVMQDVLKTVVRKSEDAVALVKTESIKQIENMRKDYSQDCKKVPEPKDVSSTNAYIDTLNTSPLIHDSNIVRGTVFSCLNNVRPMNYYSKITQKVDSALTAINETLTKPLELKTSNENCSKYDNRSLHINSEDIDNQDGNTSTNSCGVFTSIRSKIWSIFGEGETTKHFSNISISTFRSTDESTNTEESLEDIFHSMTE